MRVVCTAGHVDHGKSALVRALTGMEPDRFAEERRRGLTIDLGFAWAQIAGHTIAFVDLPGHERFIANMLAGAGAVDLVMFVVAADEGWMPQSQEHLDILDLLGVSRGLVAVTKADTVDADTLDIASELITEELAGSSLAGIPIVGVSAETGHGLDTLRGLLGEVLDAAPAPVDRGRPRLWVDRSFSIRGAGTVVTGTLAEGTLRAGDELMVLPAARPARIRAMECLKAPVEQAPPGSRVAVNLVGVERREVGRGDALGRRGQWLAAHRTDAWVRVLPGYEIGKRGAWHVHAGSGEWLARIAPVAGRPIATDGFISIDLEAAAPLCAGDRFVLREAGRRATLGGGVVLDPDPLRPRGAAERAARVNAMERRLAALDDPAALLALHVTERGAADAARAAAAVGLASDELAAAIEQHRLLVLGPALAAPVAAARWSAAVTAGLQAHHRANPVERVAAKDLAARAAIAAGCPPHLAGHLLDALAGAGTIVAEGPGLRHPDHAVRLDPAQAEARRSLLATLDAARWNPPALSAAAARAGASPALVRELEATGDLVRLGPDLAMSAGAVAAAVDRLRTAFAVEGPLTAARAKEMLDTSRKYALPLLEELDRRGATRRRGDVRDVTG
ncbi:MAG: selenocysteine-specific translation elongation factor [Euzebyaceae bacterium]|jgi:selenocysteine-specific elongation factor|nr:selenocysteine-specific translation elongation factor [Euzebyaceae bacterium]